MREGGVALFGLVGASKPQMGRSLVEGRLEGAGRGIYMYARGEEASGMGGLHSIDCLSSCTNTLTLASGYS